MLHRRVKLNALDFSALDLMTKEAKPFLTLPLYSQGLEHSNLFLTDLV